jgi:ribitol-5-phosphate 2-dehydrogenase (NADP+) / D-ribitol-5-phosphate cytidylyltransferase
MKHSTLPQYAVILAAGTGSRFGSDEPKQFIRLGGIPIFIRTLRLFLDEDVFARVILVVHSEHFMLAQGQLDQFFPKSKVQIVVGGPTRTKSVELAVRELIGVENGVIVIHDAVRPFLEFSTVEQGLQIIQFGKADGVDTAVPSFDTIVRIDPETRIISEVPKRSEYLRGQTPQFFLLSKLIEAFKFAELRDYEFTEECGLLLAAFPDSKIVCIEGSERNMKITTKQDLITAQNLLRTPSSISVRDDLFINGNVAIVGGSRGLGLELKSVLSSRGVNAKSFSRTEGQDINDLQGRISIIDWISNLEEKTHLVFTVGSILHDSILNLDEKSFLNEYKTNLISIAISISEALQRCREKLDSIVLIGSTAGVEGRENLISYSSSKAGLVAFMQAVSNELLELGIRINVIVPERIRSELRKEKFLEEKSSYLEEFDVVEVILECLVGPHHGKVFSVRKM